MLTNSLTEPAATVKVNEGDRVTARRGDRRARYRRTCKRNSNRPSTPPTPTNPKRRSGLYRAADDRTGARYGFDRARSGQRNRRPTCRKRMPTSRATARSRAKGYLSAQALQTQQTLANVYTANVRSNQAALELRRSSRNAPTARCRRACKPPKIVVGASKMPRRHARKRGRSRAQISRATIVSPVDGIVVNRNLNPGEYPGARTIFVLQQVDPVFAELNASSADVFRVQRGAPVALTIPGEPSSALSRLGRRRARPSANRARPTSR